VAYAEETEATNQYDLYVNGESFFDFPALVEFEPYQPQPPRQDDGPPIGYHGSDAADGGHQQLEAMSDAAASGPSEFCRVPAAEVDFRLSMVGLSSVEKSDEIVKDELHSELYSPMLESLRSQLSEYLPQLEDMVSRAIINAFFVDPDSYDCISNSSNSSASSAAKADPYQAEADVLWESHEFFRANRTGDAEEDAELCLSYMQRQIDYIFIRVRNDDLSPGEATRILLSVACVLGLKFAKPILKDTVIFTELDAAATDEDVYTAAMPFGSVVATAVAAGHRGFGFCRFEDADSASSLDRACRSEMGLTVRGPIPVCAMVLSESLRGVALRETVPNDLEEKKTDDMSDTSSLHQSSPPAPSQGGIPHLMAPLGSSDYEITYPFFSNLSPLSQNASPCYMPSSEKSLPVSERTCSTASMSDAGESMHVKVGGESSPVSPQSVTSLLDTSRLPQSTMFQDVRTGRSY